MQDTGYLIFNSKGVLRLVKGTRRGRGSQRPRLNAGEFAVHIKIDVPQKFFSERPLPSATLTIPERAIIEPEIIVELGSDTGEAR